MSGGRSLDSGLRGWFRHYLPAAGAGRTFFWMSLISAIGTGMYVTTSALFFVDYVGLSAAKVGIGLSVGGLIGLASGMPVGRLADRRGPRGIMLTTFAVQTLAMAGQILVHSFWEFVVATMLVSLGSSANASARGPLIRAVAQDHATTLRAQLRSVSNLGLMLGAALAGISVSQSNKDVYALMVLGNAASFGLCAVMTLRLPVIPPVPPKGNIGNWQALRDRRYLGFTAIAVVQYLQIPVLTLVLPLWIADHTHAPRWMISVMIGINTCMAAVLQVRAARGVDSPRGAAKALVRSGLAFLLSFIAIAGAAHLPAAAATVVLLLAATVYTLGELLSTAACYELSFSLAPAEAQGQYMGLYSTGTGLGRVVSPSITGALCLSWGASGWVCLGIVMLLAAAAAYPITAMAADHAQPEPAVAVSTR
ncbi:MFS family permease [Streptacidiphilus sp. BW17]|uniref:MFS transporter n=1 Tax=Streptacidiphilus sp. BW17 TaxID=3156274 RepID=UPI0035197DDC